MTTAAQLVEAVQDDNANILLGANILLDSYPNTNSYLNIDGKTVTIDLNGHKLYRDITGNHASDGHVIYVHNNAHLTLNNSTGTGSLEGGKANNGGAIFIEPGSTVSATGVTFQNNSAGDHAGAIWNKGSLSVTNCTFTNNSAFDVGAIYNATGGSGTVSISNCTFTGNSSTNGCGTIGNAAGATSMTITGGRISGGIAGTNGGGIWNSSNLTLDNVTIQNCQATNTGDDQGRGGAIFNNGGSLTIISGNFQNNTSRDGGAVYNKLDATLTIISGTFTGNSTTQYGGGAITNHGEIYVYGGTFTGNRSYANGGGIYTHGYIYMRGNPVIKDNIGNIGSTEKTNNLYLADYNDYTSTIVVDAAFTTGARIGITPYDTSSIFTLGYGGYNPDTNPDVVFFSDNYYGVEYCTTLFGKEVTLNTSVSVEAANYIDVDGTEKTIWSCNRLSAITDDNYIKLSSGWYVVDQDRTFYNRIGLAENSDVKFILADGKTLTANNGIQVISDVHFTIYGQSGQTGRLNASVPEKGEFHAAIGSSTQTGLGHITINGGVINAIGGPHASAIGCGGSGSGDMISGSITINGGTITATGRAGTGIGGGANKNPYSITINGGTITATGHSESAGIGSGSACMDVNHVPVITINGGSVTASVYNSLGVPGIGNSWQSHSNVIINGGTIYADAIGGYGNLSEYAATVTLNWSLTDNYTANVYSNCTVTLAKEFTNGLTFLPAGSVSNSALNGKTLTPPAGRNIFITDGNWNEASNWNNGTVPGSTDDAYVFADATITNTDLVEANNITAGTDGSIIIKDGGQLVCSNNVNATLEKEITGFGNNPEMQTGWYTIASPLTSNFTPSGNMLSNTYDLYEYNEPNHKWYNFKEHEGNQHPGFNLEPQMGYLYANSNTTTISFTGEMRSTNAMVSTPLSYESNNEAVKGYNLVGNPFTYDLTTSNNIKVGGEALTSYYIADGTVSDGKNLIACNLSQRPIKAGEGFFVQATDEGQSIDFNAVTRSRGTQKGYISIVAGNEDFMDRAYVQIGGGNTLRKMSINDNTAQVYVMNDGKDYAAATIEAIQGEMPVNFKATKDGSYTITVTPEGMEMGYLHLIDNLTSTDIDLLANPSYTFNATVTEYETRFHLVFSSIGEYANGDDEAPFAYYANGEIIILADVETQGIASLQVIDVMGHVLVCRDASNASAISTTGMTPGVYVLRLINGNNVKVQKVVVR